MNTKSNPSPLWIVEIWASRVIASLRQEWMLDKDKIPPALLQKNIGKRVTEMLERLSWSKSDELFTENSFPEETPLREAFEKHHWGIPTLRNQILQYLEGILINSDAILDRRIERLRTALDHDKQRTDDEMILIMLYDAKRLISNYIIPQIDTDKGKWFIQVRDDIWNSEARGELRKMYHSEKIYHMVIDLAELMMKRHLPRIVVSWQRFKHTPKTRIPRRHL